MEKLDVLIFVRLDIILASVEAKSRAIASIT
jgi:hypothetical protein